MKYLKNITDVLLITVLAVGIFMAQQKFTYWNTLQKQKEKNAAVDGCLKSATYTAEVGNATAKNTTVEPITKWYEFCMKKKYEK